MNHSNCFTISGSLPERGLPLREGILVVQPEGQPYRVTLDDLSFVPFAPKYFCEPPEVTPDSRLLSASVHFEKSFVNTYCLISPDIDERGVILLVEAKGLDFRSEPLAEGLNLWAGGDGHIPPLRKGGAHKDSGRKQLYYLRDLESIYVVDTLSTVIRIQCVNQSLVQTSVGPVELAEFLSERGKAEETKQALDWAFYNLRTLKNKYMNDAKIVTLFKEIRALKYKK